jgi:hypothetical protein
MKKLFATFALAVLMMFAVGTNDAQAQNRPQATVGQALAGLINVNVGTIQVTDVIDVSDVLNDNEIRILNNAINNNKIASNNQIELNDLVDVGQVVVGVLSGGIILVQ